MILNTEHVASLLTQASHIKSISMDPQDLLNSQVFQLFLHRLFYSLNTYHSDCKLDFLSVNFPSSAYELKFQSSSDLHIQILLSCQYYFHLEGFTCWLMIFWIPMWRPKQIQDHSQVLWSVSLLNQIFIVFFTLIHSLHLEKIVYFPVPLLAK